MNFKITFQATRNNLYYKNSRYLGIKDLERIKKENPKVRLDNIVGCVESFYDNSLWFTFDTLESVKEFSHIFENDGYITIKSPEHSFNKFCYEEISEYGGIYSIIHRIDKNLVFEDWKSEGCQTGFWNPGMINRKWYEKLFIKFKNS